MKVMRRIIGFVLAGLLTACSTVYYMPIEILEPATIEFPAGIERLLIVDNAPAAQPLTITGKIMTAGKLQDDTLVVSIDSASTVLCSSLGWLIADNSSFADILLLDSSIRRTAARDVFAADTFDVHLTPDEVRQLCEEQGVDAIISLDFLTYTAEQAYYKFNMNDGEYEWVENGLFLDVNLKGVLRMYLPGQDTPFNVNNINTTIHSLLTGLPVLYSTSAENVRYAFYYAVESLAETEYTDYVSHWVETPRWYYTSFASRWQEGTAFMQRGSWKSAAAVWQSLYNETTKPKVRARLASNLALCNELTDNIPKALEWANEANRLSVNVNDTTTRARQQQYVSLLTDRIAKAERLKK